MWASSSERVTIENSEAGRCERCETCRDGKVQGECTGLVLRRLELLAGFWKGTRFGKSEWVSRTRGQWVSITLVEQSISCWFLKMCIVFLTKELTEAIGQKQPCATALQSMVVRDPALRMFQMPYQGDVTLYRKKQELATTTAP